RQAHVTAAALERLRDRAFRRLPSRRVRSERAALGFVEEVGFCSTFYRFPDGVACLWEAVVGGANPRWPRRSHHDAGIGLTWELKDTLPSKKRVYYGRRLKGRPLLVALELFPAFYARARGRQRARDYREEYAAGRMSHTARRLMDGLVREHPQYTRGLRANAFMLEPSKTREFERAMAELQQGLWVVKTEERYEPTFSYRWDLVEAWLPEAVAELLEWATSRRMNVAAEMFDEPESNTTPIPGLVESLQAGGIFYRLGGSDKASVLRAVVEQMRLPEEVDREFLLRVLL